jgi:hypothetical protein
VSQVSLTSSDEGQQRGRLGDLDRELEQHGHRFVRHADDPRVFVRSEQAAQRRALPHLISNGSRAFIVCLANQPEPHWDGTYMTVVTGCPAASVTQRACPANDWSVAVAS